MSNPGDPVMTILEHFFSEAALIMFRIILKSSTLETLSILGIENIYRISRAFPYSPLNMSSAHKAAYDNLYLNVLGMMEEFWELRWTEMNNSLAAVRRNGSS